MINKLSIYFSGMKIQQLMPTRATIAHLRFGFSLFLLPVYLFALSQSRTVQFSNAVLIFFIWHFLAFPASNGYNSYFDRDQQSIALLKKPPVVDISLYYNSLLIEVFAFIISLFINRYFAIGVLIYGIMSKLYSHPATRLKKYPFISFLTVFFFQGAFIYWSSYFALTNSNFFTGFNNRVIIAGVICSCLIGASYPLTQVYQHQEDRQRGDRTLSFLLGFKGSFIFSGVLFVISTVLMYLFWLSAGSLVNFYLFLFTASPIFLFFNWWFYKVISDTLNADFKNAMRMNFISSACMIAYFAYLCLYK